ncbi:M48 family metalloprotease [Hwanghaeella sp.]|uniref:M48 family metallopeptidase n=1 Tax=Hwanghaeella sp. TaxID=2605943 RepID=UPI003CCC098A
MRKLLAGTAGLALAVGLTACQTASEAYRAPINAAKTPTAGETAPETPEQDQEQTASPSSEQEGEDIRLATREAGGGTYSGSATDYRIDDLNPGERPDLSSDEAGIWMMMDRAERKLATSGRVINDPALKDYVGKMVCDLAGDYCGDIRVYIVRKPEFNATMAPNGTMSVYSGLLLRARNEAQLATVLGHEIGHYLRRHSYQQMKDRIDKTNGLVFFRVFTAALGVPVVGDIAALGTIGSIASFGRDHEREADGYGILLMARAGYSPHEAAKIWENLNAELGDEKRSQSFFYSTHPETSERQAMLRQLADEVPVAGGDGGTIGTEAYRDALSPHWRELLADEVAKRDYGRTERLFDSLIADGFRAGAVYYYKGEMYRQRGEEGDEDLALAAYHAATQFADAPPELFKARGQIFQRKGLKAEARASYEEYVRLSPDAADRKMIEFMIGGLGS